MNSASDSDEEGTFDILRSGEDSTRHDLAAILRAFGSDSEPSEQEQIDDEMSFDDQPSQGQDFDDVVLFDSSSVEEEEPSRYEVNRSRNVSIEVDNQTISSNTVRSLSLRPQLRAISMSSDDV